MNNKIFLPFALSSFMLAMSGCGGESATIYEDPNTGVKTSTNGCDASRDSCLGFVVTYPVEGLNFDCSSDTKNHFITQLEGNIATGGCAVGDKVSFYIQGQNSSRKIQLGTVDLKQMSPLKVAAQPVQISLLDIAKGMTGKDAVAMDLTDPTFKTTVGITRIFQAIGLAQNGHILGDIQPIELTVKLKNDLEKLSADVTASEFTDGRYENSIAPWLNLGTVSESVAENVAEQMILLKNVNIYSANFLAVSALNADVGGFHGKSQNQESIANMYLLTTRQGYTTGYTIQWKGKPLTTGSQVISSIGRINLLTQVPPIKLNANDGLKNWLSPLNSSISTPLSFKTTSTATDQLDIYEGTLLSQKAIVGTEYMYKQITGSSAAPTNNVYGQWRQRIDNENFTGSIDMYQSNPATYLDRAVFKTINTVNTGENYIFPLYATLEFSFQDLAMPVQKVGIVIDEFGDIRTNRSATSLASDQCLTVNANMQDSNGVQQYRIGTTGAANQSSNDKSITLRMILANPIFGPLDGALIGLNEKFMYLPQDDKGNVPSLSSGGVRLNLQNLISSNTTASGINITGWNGAVSKDAEWLNMHAAAQAIYETANKVSPLSELAKRQQGKINISLPACYSIKTKT